MTTTMLVCIVWMRAHVAGWSAAERDHMRSPVVEIRADGVCVGSLPSGTVTHARCNAASCTRAP